MQKIIRRSIKICKVSAKKYYDKKFEKEKINARKFENICRKLLTVSEKSIEESIRSVEKFFEAKFECGRIIYWLFDKWFGFWQLLLRKIFIVLEGLSSFAFIYWMIGGI